MLVRRVSHVHVSERETAHRWPDGRLDDRAWEDCRFDAGVELLRAAGHDVPPTHAEAEAIRAASGLPPTGGSRPDDLARGVRRRYGVDLPAWIGGGPEVVAALRPGTAAVLDGSLGRFPPGHRLRRWQPGFTGGHSLYVERTLGGVWLWCDPLAPVGTHPDRVAEADVRTFTWGGVVVDVALVEQQEGTMYPIVTREPFPAPVAWHVAAGTTLRGYDPARPGGPVKEVRFDRDSLAHATARVGVRWVGVDPDKAPVPRGAQFLEVADGAFAGLLIVAAQVRIDPLPDPCADAVRTTRVATIEAAVEAVRALAR